MMLVPIDRASHWTDYRVVGGGKRRGVRNWSNFETPSGIFAPSNQTYEVDAAKPPDWSGQWDFKNRVLNSAAELFFGDTTTPGDTALAGMRRSNRPGEWLNLKMLDVSAVEPAGNEADLSTTWPEIVQGTDLIWEVQRNGMRKLLTVRPDSPNSYGFSLRISPAATLEIHEGEGGWFRVLDPQGNETIRTTPVGGWYLDDEGLPYGIRVTLTRGADRQGMPTIWLSANEDDLAAAWAAGATEATLDPQTVVSGTTDILDNAMRVNGGQRSHNLGGNIFKGAGAAGTSDVWRTLYKVLNSAIPEGTIDAVTMDLWQQSNGASKNADSATFYRVLPLSPTWVEGTATSALQAGSCSAMHPVHNTANWNSGDTSGDLPNGACGVSGTDYNATSEGSFSFPAKTSGGDTQHTITLTPGTFQDWKAGTYANDGLILFGATETTKWYFCAIRQSEHASGPTFTIDYSTGPSNSPFFYSLLLQNRRR